MNEVDVASRIWGSGGADAADPTELPAADMGDVAEFQDWLQAVPQQVQQAQGAAESSALGSVLQMTSNSLHEQEERLTKTLRRVAQTGDPVEGLAVQRQLSDLYLTHGLAVKVISKTSQALETLSRLQ
jgi:hypothetical protein